MNDSDERKGFIAPVVDERAVAALVLDCGLEPLTARVLVARGIDTPASAERFLTPSLDRDWHDPDQIPGLLDAADRIEREMRAGGRILVFGDFDVDGLTATTVLVRGLRALGAAAEGLIPHRYEEGYALSETAVRRGMELHPDLIVTVDCGISNGFEVAEMLVRGIDVVITDHHEPGGHVPQDIPVADPKLSEDCPSRDLAGVGVALKLVCVLGQRLGQPDLWRELTDFAALGTVSDLMPLTPENRAIVADGVHRINTDPRPCLAALSTICGVTAGDMTSTRLSFSLIPRLNAAGRMGDATVALDLLLSDGREQAERLAADLDAINKTRREVESTLAEQVEERLRTEYHGEPVIVIAAEGWHEGVKGIVAARIAKKYRCPAIIFTVEDGVARGSGRSYGDINLFDIVGRCSDIFDRFGGHMAAIGITMPVEHLDELRDRLCDLIGSLPREEKPQGMKVDATVRLAECSVAGFHELQRLEPFGNTNPVPVLAAPNVFLERCAVVGKGGNHLRFQATDGAASVAGIFFNCNDVDFMLSCDVNCDIVFEPTIDEWQGRETPKLRTSAILMHEPAPSSPLDEHIRELFSRSAEICDTGEYAGITWAERFNTKVVGVTFENRQDILIGLEAGVELALVRQHDNEFDANAIAVTLLDGLQLGYLNRRLAARLAPVMDAGVPYDAAVSAVTGGPQREGEEVRKPGPLGVRDPGVIDRSFGVNIVVRRADILTDSTLGERQFQEELWQTREQWRSIPSDELDDRLREVLIGNRPLHDAQMTALDALAHGRRALVVMATGRGKSLIFHIHAARTALREEKASVFVYPLRALVADQAFHLMETYARFGLNVRILTGETDEDDRTRIFDGLTDRRIDVVLTTPEFLGIHASRFQATGRIGFVVVDEAHHVGLSKAGNRPAYAGLKQTLEELGSPQVLAVTATADDRVASTICSTLSIEEVILDPTVRTNLQIDDRRDLRDRENYLASLVASGTKCVVYVNSRDQTISLARMLRHRVPELAPSIAFYNAGLSKDDRKRVETAFREGDLRTIVSTSAFGEGIDIPDIRHVVLYHLPFSDVEFNQMAGRAGRDGDASVVHLLYGYGDARINEKILSSSAPSRDQMVALYRVLRDQGQTAARAGETEFMITNSELADLAKRADKRCKMDEGGVSTAISVFRELGFLETSGHGIGRRIRMVKGPDHMELTDSVRYREGAEEIEEFVDFKQWALGASNGDLLARFNRPILPEHPEKLPTKVEQD